MAKFLSDDWFAKVDELASAAEGLEIPKAMKDVTVNLTVTSGEVQVPLCINGGIIQKGRLDKADVDMSMPDEYARKILVEGDWSVGMKGWVSRKIKVSGNMRKLIPLQVFNPTDSQEDLRKKIEDITDR